MQEYTISKTSDMIDITRVVMTQTKSTPTFLGLIGDLGSGKTTFVQQLSKELKMENNIISPTFIIHREYTIPNTKNYLHHLDVYRLQDETELDEIVTHSLFTNQNIIAVEWADKFRPWFEKICKKSNTTCFWLKFEHIDENTRLVKIDQS